MTGMRLAREHGFAVKVRANVDHTNRESVRALFHTLKAEGLFETHPSGGRVLAYSAAIFTGCGGCTTGQMTKAEHADFEMQLRADGVLGDNDKFRALRFTGATCAANVDYEFVINQRGVLTKCWQHGTDAKHAIGTVDDLAIAVGGSRAVDGLAFSPLDDPECRECTVLPLCLGGCKANNEFAEKGYAGTKDIGCHAARFTLPQHVLRAYALRV